MCFMPITLLFHDTLIFKSFIFIVDYFIGSAEKSATHGIHIQFEILGKQNVATL
jgi:hypothetical protein